MKILKSEKGLAMPLILMVLIVITLLGTALWHYGVSELNFSVRDEKRARAYYLARAGAESVARYVIQEPSVLVLIPEVGDTISSDQIGFEIENNSKVGDIAVELERIAGNSIEVTGTGTVDDIMQRVALILETQQIPDGTLILSDDANFQNNVSIVGDIVSGGTVKWQNQQIEGDTHPQVDGTITQNAELEYSSQTFPTIPQPYTGELIVNPGEETTIASSPPNSYESIVIERSGRLIVDARSGSVLIGAQDLTMHRQAQNTAELVLITDPQHELEIVVDSIAIAKITVQGDGVAKIYARNSVDVRTPHAQAGGNVFIEDSGHLVLYLDDGCIMTLQAGSSFRGLVYGPEATMQMAGGVSFEGVMIAEKLKGAGPGQGGQGGGSEIIGDAGTSVEHIDLWSGIGFDFGGYWMVHWIR